MLGTLHIIICRCQKFGHHALNIVSDVSRLRQGGSIGNSKRHIQQLGQSLYQIGLAAAGRTDHQNVGLLNYHSIRILLVSAQKSPLVMIINCHADGLFCFFLANYILVQLRFDLMRGRNILHGKNRLFLTFSGLLLFRPLLGLSGHSP